MHKFFIKKAFSLPFVSNLPTYQTKKASISLNYALKGNDVGCSFKVYKRGLRECYSNGSAAQPQGYADAHSDSRF